MPVPEPLTHMQALLEAVLAAGNVATDGGFRPNQGGWDCLVRHPIDVDVVAEVLTRDTHSNKIAVSPERVECLHCWSSIVWNGGV